MPNENCRCGCEGSGFCQNGPHKGECLHPCPKTERKIYPRELCGNKEKDQHIVLAIRCLAEATRLLTVEYTGRLGVDLPAAVYAAEAAIGHMVEATRVPPPK